MIRFPPIALAALAAATLGLTACGGGNDDGPSDADAKASKQLQQERGIPKAQADELVAASERLKGLSDADAAELKRAVSDGQRRAIALQQQLVTVTKDLEAKKITEATATKRISTLRRRIQEQALATASTLEKAGALPPTAKKQVEQARKQIESGTATGSDGPTAPGTAPATTAPAIPSQ